MRITLYSTIDWFIGCWNRIFDCYLLDYNLTTYENNFLFTDSFGDVLISLDRDIYATERLLRTFLPADAKYKIKAVLEDTFFNDNWMMEKESVASLLTYVESRTGLYLEKIIVTANEKEYTIY